MQAVIIATDEAEKLHPLRGRLPAPMLPVGGRPLLAGAIERLAELGIRQIVVCLHRRGSQIVEYAGTGGRWSVQIQYVALHEPLGGAGALRWAAGCLRGPFVVLPADVVAELDLAAALASHGQSGADVTALVAPDGAATGVWICGPAVPGHIPAGPCELDEALLGRLAGAGLAVRRYQASGYWNPLATAADYQAAQAHTLRRSLMLEGDDAHATAARGQLRRLAPGVWAGRGCHIHPTARVVAPVTIGPGTWIGRNAEVGPEVVVGAHSVIGAGATVRRSTLLDRTYVGRLALLDGRIADGGLLINPASGAAMRVEDPVLLDTAAPDAARGGAWAGRLIGGALLLAAAPLLLALVLIVALATRRWPLQRFRYVGRPPAGRAGAPGAAHELRLWELALAGPDGEVGALGRWLWRWELQRLPRLWNVVAGELALVGVRPLHVEEAAQLREEWHQTRFERAAGFTGLWYVQSHPQYDIDAIVTADVYYAVTAGWRSDVGLLLQTPLAWVARRLRRRAGEPARPLLRQIAS